jgi:hypothetical protein
VSINIIGVYPDGLLAGLYGFSMKTEVTVTEAQIVVDVCIVGLNPEGLPVGCQGFFVKSQFNVAET